MTNDKINKLIKNNIYLITLVLLIFISIFSTNYFFLYKKNQETKLIDSLDNIFLNKAFNEIIENLKPRFDYKNFRIKQGDTFEKLLKELIVEDKKLRSIVSSIN